METVRWLIVTDLDGTLLDHDTYSAGPAKDTLAALARKNIPVVINSSKTYAEITTLRKSLNNSHPFVIENGSAVTLPSEYFNLDSGSTDCVNSSVADETIILGTRREALLALLPKLTTLFKDKFLSYSQCSIDDIVRLTGLSFSEATDSANRHYSEPMKWLGSDVDKQNFVEYLHQHDVYCLEGGRFIHLMGNTDKGKATHFLAKQYSDYYQQPLKTIALGDSHNDIAMLQAADIAVVVRSPYHAPPEFDHPHKIISNAYGPAGWSEVICSLVLKK